MKFLPIMRMIVTSDVHVREDTNIQLDKFEKGMKFANEYADNSEYKKVDAFFSVGDFANSGSETEMLIFKNSLKKVIKNDTKCFLSLASHEFKSGGTEVAEKRLKKVFGSEPDTHTVINGFHCIMLSTEANSCSIKEKKQQWLKEELKKAAADEPKKPIFCFQHPHLTDTVYGSINWGDDDIISILMDYPQVIDFSGHSHAPINDPRSVYQKYFTCFGTGSFNYFELDEFDKIYGTVPPDCTECGQFLIVEVDENYRVRVLPVDAITSQFFPCEKLIEKPYEPKSFVYTDERYKTSVKPYFKDDAFVKIDINSTNMNIEFSQASISEDYVDNYTVVVRKTKDDIIVRQFNISSLYYLTNMPDTIKVSTDVPEYGEYYIEVTAAGFWNNYSYPIKKSFTV